MYLGSESDTDRDEAENKRIEDLAMNIAKKKRKGGTIYLEDF